MSNIINNTDLDKIRNTAENGRKNRQSLKKPVKLEGEWNLFDLDKGYQFRTEISYEKGKEIIEIDSPSFLGGNGNRLGPMAYCIAGITSCFIATFVTVASSQGIGLNKLKVSSECNINWPRLQGINFEIDAQSKNADKQRLQEILTMAEERCPAMYSMLHRIKVDAKLL